ncbi:ribonucleotide-diphosphate reductase subunit alpha, partial [candidate division WWE3 bacterium CG_4_9_14_3_um_filter_34_6]
MNKLKAEKSATVTRPAMNADLIAKRYAQEGEKSWTDVVKRVSGHAGGKDKELNKRFFDAILSGRFFPSRMTYMGTKHPFASSCFVFPIEDSLVSIMKTLSEACQVQKYGGGTGYNFSHLRPQGDIISTSGGEASGPVSFMGLFHRAMEVVHRAGKKHAAQMGILNCDHPNIYEFIQCKDQEGAFWTFNISVAVTDEFMEAVKNDADWNLKFGGKIYKTVKAKELWNYIIQHAWFNGDPGIIFIDTVNKNNKYPETIEACNPCGEQMLPPHVSCNLGSVDLSRFVISGEIDWVGLKDTVRSAVRFLDHSVLNAYWPVKKIQTKTRKYRNIGLGVMGWADMLILLGVSYDSNEAIKLGEEVMRIIDEVADDESKIIGGGKRVNTTVTSIAPTGSISLLAGCSSGIEPLFGVVTMKNTYVGSYSNVHWIFESIAKERGFYSEELMKQIAELGSVQNIPEVPDDVKSLFKTTGEIAWIWHVKHQAAFQKNTDNAVSKTINLPNDATAEDVEKAYFMAYEIGCKSITVYRDGSRQIQVMDAKQKAREMCPNCNAILFMNDGVKSCVTCGYTPSRDNEATNPTMNNAEIKINSEINKEAEVKKPRPEVVNGRTYRIRTPY